ncbi:MAG TPA: GNAT family N-acetyltransferase [Marinilabiliaceae bacterium]|nr:GNAT family N-acetyltransferase [Marinilabiliaceae bacterium]
MSKLKIIQTPNLFKQFWNLMTFSFPEVERRDCEDFVSICEHPAFVVSISFDHKTELEHFITHWELDKFIYVEHFALSHHLRGKGMGSSVLKDFMEKYKRPIVLEVEPPTNAISRRRIRFYERLGFTLFHWDYQQPPYRTSDDSLALLLMTSSPELLKNKNGFQYVKTEIHRHVYASI